MKSIGIITFHRAHNFGAVLQAFALQQFLSDSCISEIIDYRSKCIENYYYSPLRLKSIIKSIVLKKEDYKDLKIKLIRKHKFEKFQNLLAKSKCLNEKDLKEHSRKYDYVITGSDQVWNADIVRGDLNYFLNFVEPKKRRTYAVSFGNKSILTNKNKHEMIYLISSLKKILIRENDGISILSNLGIDSSVAEMVCDPVFLLNKEQWFTKLNLNMDTNQYIFAFFVNDPINSLSVVKKIHDETGLPVKYCHSYGRERNVPNWCENYMDIGPIEFMQLLYNAKYVVTTSFHGMALSIRLNKQFFYELNKNGTNSRLNTLADIFSLHDREIIDDNIPTQTNIDFANINQILDKYASASKSALLSTIYGKGYEKKE